MNDDRARYASVLQEGRNLAIVSVSCPETLFRDGEVHAILAAMLRGRSVMITGGQGVGKTAVLHSVAKNLGECGEELREFSVSQIIAGTRYLGDWQSKLSALMDQAEAQRAILYILDIVNLVTAGASSQSSETFVDALRPRMSSGKIRIVGEAGPDQLSALSRVPGFMGLFDIVPVEPLTREQLRQVVEHSAMTSGIKLDRASISRLLQLCETFQPGISGPGPGLELLAKTKEYQEQKRDAGEDATADPVLIEKVFSIHSGLPRFVVSSSERKSVSEIREWFRARIVGQEAAVDAVVEMTAHYKSRLHDKTRPIGSFLFVGPTGVGKTELARALATFFFGSERRMLRFDMSEFTDYNAFEMLVGNPREPSRPARLVDPVRAQPFQVILFDEIEKGHKNIQDLLLQLLDEGRLTTPRGETISFRNAIVIATSNAGAAEGMTPAMGFERSVGTQYDADKALQAIESQFRPEFINRFQHFVLFHPLTLEQAARIAQTEIQSVLKREGITERNLAIDIDRSAIDLVLTASFNTRHGARAIKREVNRQIILPIATLLMERDIAAGSLIHVICRDGRLRLNLADTEEVRRAKAESQPIRARTGERLTRTAIQNRATTMLTALYALMRDVELKRLRDEIEEIELRRKDYQFWHDPDQAGRTLARQARLLETVSRLERLEEGIVELDKALAAHATRSQLDRLVEELLQLEDALGAARRELLVMGGDGYWDAIVEIAPVGADCEARGFLYKVYADWARERGSQVLMVREPDATDEPLMIAVRGHYAFGYLKGEAGHHRVRHGTKTSVARVTVAAWSDRTESVPIVQQRALKRQGQFGGRLRSRIEFAGSGLVIQNERTLNENRELGCDIAANWQLEPAAAVAMVRRIDLNPFLCRDFLTETDYARGDILSPRLFNGLLAARVDREAEQRKDHVRSC